MLANDATAPASDGSSAFPASRIARFDITGVLGSGGMGIVLEASDPELDRRVAIKVLHSSQGGARLQREAQAMAKVAHPNVVAVYEVGRVEGRVYLAMELVEGTTLRAWLATERSWRAIVETFVAAGRGLAAAHELGLVHCDFKPENVLVGVDGRPRVADFGLVTREPRAIGGGDEPPTRSLTIEGSAVGTPAYMAPEQWLGEDVDARADQFSFCVALWEAVHRQRPFPGTTASELRAAVIAGREPAAPALPAVPRWLDQVLRRGLAREPAARWASMTALLDALTAGSGPRRRAPWIVAALGGAALLAGGIAVSQRGGDPEAAATRAERSDAAAAVPGFSVSRESIHRVTFGAACEELPALSSDGATIYYDAPTGADYHLYAIDRTGGAPRQLTTTKGWDLAATPSPDGRHLAFLRLANAEPMTLFVGDVAQLHAARRIVVSNMRPVWSPDGTHVWAGGRPLIERYDVASGKPDRSLRVPADHVALYGLELPDGRFVALLHPIDRSALIDQVIVYPAGGGEPTLLVKGNLGEVIALHPDGASVIISVMASNRGVELWRQPLVREQPATQLTTGMIAARSRLAIAGRTIVWSDCREYIHLAKLGPSNTFEELGRTDWADWNPVRAGPSEVAFLSDRAGRFEVLRQDLTRGGEPARIPLGGLEPVAFDVSRDGSFVAAGEGTKGLYVVPASGSPKLLFAETGDLAPSIDRHGSTIYFERHSGDRYRIAAIPTAGGEPRWVAPEGSVAPAASPTADVLAYLAPTGKGTAKVMLLDVVTGKTRALSPDAPPVTASALRWSPDGKRLLLVDRNTGLRELDATTGAVLRELPSGAAQIAGAAYVGAADLVVGHQTVSGDVWTAQLE